MGRSIQQLIQGGVVMFFPIWVYAQSWAPPEAVWYYNFFGLSGQGYVRITYVQDTIINGVSCKQLNKRLYQENTFTGTVQSYNIGSVFTYENNGVVFIRYSGVFDTLYNFNAIPGESWHVPGTSPVSACNAVSRIEVIDTATVFFHQVPLKLLIVHYHYFETGHPFVDTIIERIGSLRQYMVPWDICLSLADGHEGGELRCYSDNLIGEFKHNFYSPCTAIIGIEEMNETAAHLTVFPNPTANVVYIVSNKHITKEDTFYITLKEVTGRILQSYPASPINTPVDLANYPPGIYYLHIANRRSGQMICRSILKF